tara:strand:+ start:12726 stop:13031 length:306 start_codon:yes stop_codon:yes gene_type:complete
MKYIVTNIKYDTDGEDIDLPQKLIINTPKNICDDDDIEEYISDDISNQTGFCHKGFECHIMTQWLCVEDGEEFTLQAETLQEAQEYASIYNAEVINELVND